MQVDRLVVQCSVQLRLQQFNVHQLLLVVVVLYSSAIKCPTLFSSNIITLLFSFILLKWRSGAGKLKAVWLAGMKKKGKRKDEAQDDDDDNAAAAAVLFPSSLEQFQKLLNAILHCVLYILALFACYQLHCNYYSLLLLPHNFLFYFVIRKRKKEEEEHPHPHPLLFCRLFSSFFSRLAFYFLLFC